MKTLMLLMVMTVMLGGAALAQYDAPTAPDCPAGSGEIVFVSNRDGDTNIYVMDVDGSNQTQLTSDPNVDISPRWSPDGSLIAFTSDRTGSRDIWIMDADGSSPTQITNSSAEASYPVWTPDSESIIYTSFEDGTGDLYIVNIATGEERLFLDVDGTAFASAYSPDGTQLAWEHDDFAGFYNIFMLDDANNPASNFAVTQRDTDHNFGFSWSPDGKQALFNYGAIDGNGTFVAYLEDSFDIEADPVLVTDFTDNIAVPIWSPDARRITFSVDEGAGSNVFVIDRDGSNLRNLTADSSADDYYPDWRECPAG